MRPPLMAVPDSDDDPYIELVKAVLNRAIGDAQGACSPTVAVPVAQLRAEALGWLRDTQAVASLVELAGFDAAPVVRRIRQLLADVPAVVHAHDPQLVLFGDGV